MQNNKIATATSKALLLNLVNKLQNWAYTHRRYIHRTFWASCTFREHVPRTV